MRQYVTENELSNITGIAVQTLRNWRHERRGFPYVKVGRSIRYELDEIDEYMQERKIKPGEIRH